MKVGIDFGTTYTKIAYMEGDELKLFAYPGPTDTYIPTAVAYRGGEIFIGRLARSVKSRQGVQYADRFKMLLPVREKDEWAKWGWKLERSPGQVTKDFFQQLMVSLERFLGTRPESIVVSIPELWQRTANNFGAEALRRLLVEELNLPVDHLRSEPVCAAAYFVHAYRRSQPSPGDNFNLLVCDMGGGTFDVALCRVRGQRIDVLDFDGMGEQGWGAAGALFDRNAVEAALGQYGQQLSSAEINELLHDFEEQKIVTHEQVSALLNLLLENDNPTVQDTIVYEFGHKGMYKLNFAQVKQCFEPIRKAIVGVLQRVLQRCREREWSIDRVAIVGGFGQFPLVERTILETLGIHPNDSRFDRTLHSQHRQFYAVAYGAALIANGIIEPVEYYPHTVAVRVSFKSGGLLKEAYLPVLEAGKAPAGMITPHWAEHKGERVLVRVDAQSVGRLPVYLRLRGRGNWIALDLPPEEYPEPGDYYIGIIIDRSNMGTLVFESADGKKRREYRLGNINPVLIVEEHDVG